MPCGLLTRMLVAAGASIVMLDRHSKIKPKASIFRCKSIGKLCDILCMAPITIEYGISHSAGGGVLSSAAQTTDTSRRRMGCKFSAHLAVKIMN